MNGGRGARHGTEASRVKEQGVKGQRGERHGSKVKRRWSLYVLECSDGTLYTGITNDLSRRLAQHNSGKASRYTRGRLPVKLVHTKLCRGRSHALKREYALKQLSRSEKIAAIGR